ncbi:MAG TPA: hypothetical protein VNW90_12570 [Acetobacteraceae bacterium]|jgi:hypothetical protein|nr:hypothetical protein [Acetobacteraceae bacterium]
MPVSPAASVPPLSPGEMQLLLSRAGLALNPGQVADLVLAWRQVAGLIASLPRDRPLADDMAYTFRLMPRTPVPAAITRPKPAGTVTKAKAPAARSRTAVKAKARATATPKRGAAKRAGRKSGKRGR